MRCIDRAIVPLAFAWLAACDDAADPGLPTDANDHTADTPDAQTDTLDAGSDPTADAIDVREPLPPVAGTALVWDPTADLTDPAAFWSQPFPSDQRVTVDGAPDWSALPHPRDVVLIDGVIAQAAERRGFPAMPVVYFQFDGPVAPQDPDAVYAATAESPIWLARIDGNTPQLIPTVARTLPPDPYTPPNLLAIAPRPGFVLDANARYAAVVLRTLRDSDGDELGVPSIVRNLLADNPAQASDVAPFESAARDVVHTAEQLGVDIEQIAAFTVFTTGDPASELLALTDAVVATHTASITGYRVAEGGDTHERFCHLSAVVELPQFQTGAPPYADAGGTFVFDSATGLPVPQRTERVPIALTIPRAPMPEAGYPFVLYLHGSGGTSTQVVDRGPVREPGGPRTPGLGPAHVLAGRGMAAAGTALPINPERVPGATDISYIVANPLAFRDNIRQGTIEQRLLYRVMADVEIPAAVMAQCNDPVFGEDPVRFDTSSLLLMGQSQGGHYVNVVAAVDREVDVVVPTGAGGFMSWLVLEQPRNNLRPILAAILGSTPDLHYTHPAMALLQTAWEPIEPLLYMARLHDRPLPGRGPLSVYAPVAEGDSFYPTHIYDAVALAYRSPLAGTPTWPSLGAALTLAGVEPRPAFPISGTVYEGAAAAAIVQFEGDGLEDPHSIFSQLDSVKHQYACFFRTHLDYGLAILTAPGNADDDCPAPP